MFTVQDSQQFNAVGIKVEQVQQQIKYFQEGFPFTKVTKAATIGDGILRLNETQQKHSITYYELKSIDKSIYKFVPASGAASRMFKDLFAYLNAAEQGNEAEIIEQPTYKIAKQTIENLEKFAFFDDLKASLIKSSLAIEDLLVEKKYSTILRFLLDEEGLNYSNLPKGLLQFHQYGNESRTPMEEHFVEGAKYCKMKDNTVQIHFTVSPEHQEKFEVLVSAKKAAYEKWLGVQLVVSFSQQAPHTDTIAVELDNTPFRLEDGSILFRPGGHGALIENLNQLEADLVFIKNIDNVVPDALKAETYHYKKVIGGILLQLQHKIFDYLEKLDAVNGDSQALIQAIEQLYKTEMCTQFPTTYEKLSLVEKVKYLHTKLNRPIRVCGMVKNEGEPGGGPFWTENPDGTVSLQIVESAQINVNDINQIHLLKTSSHFNPVDIVCTMKNYKGERFDLLAYVNPQQGFIVQKSSDGRELKALELPGLWNGSMSDWNTVFVEVPVITFNPVKQVTDLLRPAHQGK